MEGKLQEAIRWVNEERRRHPDLKMPVLLEDAARRFDLALGDQHHLRKLFHA